MTVYFLCCRSKLIVFCIRPKTNGQCLLTIKSEIFHLLKLSTRINYFYLLRCCPLLQLAPRNSAKRKTGSQNYNPGQNVLGHLRELGTKTHFAKLTHILPLKKAWGCCYKGLFLLSPSPPSSVDCVKLKLEYITSTLHRGGRGEGRCLNSTSDRVSVPRVLTGVVVLFHVRNECRRSYIQCGLYT